MIGAISAFAMLLLFGWLFYKAGKAGEQLEQAEDYIRDKKSREGHDKKIDVAVVDNLDRIDDFMRDDPDMS